MGHPLDDMLAKLKVVRDGDVEAYLDPYAYRYGIGWDDVCAAEVVLTRIIFGLEPDDLGDFFWSEFGYEWPEFPEPITDEWLEAQAQGAGPEDRAHDRTRVAAIPRRPPAKLPDAAGSP
jgi:hypothetical protein